MIASLRGVLVEVERGESSGEVVLDVGGVGYRVSVGPRLVASLQGLGDQVLLFIHTHVREAAISLYGFSSPEERRTFELLLGAHGVGPALALSILSALAPRELARAIGTGDVDALMLVPGVGRKTAQRLVIELAQRAELIDAGTLAAGASARGGSEFAEVREALSGLGYAPEEIRAALEHLPEEGSLEELLKSALFELAPGR